MTDVTAKRFDEMEAALGGVFVRARAELGVSAFGMQVINLPPHFDEPYAEHAHDGMPDEPFANHGQEEVYVPLAAAAPWSRRRAPGARAGHGRPRRAAQLRNFVTGDEPLQFLAIGGRPASPTSPAVHRLGAGDDPAGGGGVTRLA